VRSLQPALLVLALVLAPACSVLAKSPALADPLHDRLAKAELPAVEDATKACLTSAGWKTDPVDSIAEGSTVVNATDTAKHGMSVYIHGAEVSPRVTGGPPYDDPFWTCLDKQLAGGSEAPAASTSAAAADKP
jgi:hypothetical protein